MHYLNTLWESVTSETVKNCFRKCGFRRSQKVEQPEPCVSSDPDPCMTDDDDMYKELRSAGTELAFSGFTLWMTMSQRAAPKPLLTSWRTCNRAKLQETSMTTKRMSQKRPQEPLSLRLSLH